MARKITCSIRCLAPETVRAAREDMKGAAVGTVPFVCALSGRPEEVLLITDEAAARLAAADPALGGPLAQKIAAAILRAELCECDIATATQSDEGAVLDTLDRLRAQGVARCRDIDGMAYYSLADGAARERLDGHLAALRAS